MKLLMSMADRAWLPDPLIRLGIRRLNRLRLRGEAVRHGAERIASIKHLANKMRLSPVAIRPDKANDQHYELPAAFFKQVLGTHLKYSCALWLPGMDDLNRAEADMLALTARHAKLGDGMQILELGCGWGSLTLWMAVHFPGSRIVAVSNSASQRRFIETRCREQGIDNVQVITADMNCFSTDQRFDRVVSVEMFEHMRNWEVLLHRIGGWLKDDGRVFIHIFSHSRFAYPFETDGGDNWMGRHFFTGGIMPADDLIFRFRKDLNVEEHWRISGIHYHRTAEAWLANMDHNRKTILPLLADVYGSDQASLWFQRWRIFFMACSEVWNHDGGREWIVSHYRMKKPARH